MGAFFVKITLFLIKAGIEIKDRKMSEESSDLSWNKQYGKMGNENCIICVR